MSLVDRVVYRFIHRDRHGATGRAQDEVGGSGHAGARPADEGHRGDLTEPGRFGGDHADRYAHGARSRSRRRFYRRIARDVAGLAPRGGHVLDVGTGPGRLLVEIARARPDVRVTGVDVEPAMVRIAARVVLEESLGARAEVHVADVTALPLVTASVDVVVATLTAHHWPDVPAAVSELLRLLRPGGVLLVVDFGSAVHEALRSALEVAAPEASSRRETRWAWGLPALTAWEIRVPNG